MDFAARAVEDTQMGVVVSMVSRKGGVGKTSLCYHLAGVLADDGLRVRLVDLDNQASLSQLLLGPGKVESLRRDETAEACFIGATPAEIELPTPIDGVTIVPAHLQLGVKQDSRIDLRQGDVDITLVDTPPDLVNPVVPSALLTSDFAILPLTPETLAVRSMASVHQALYSVSIAGNPSLVMLGYLINMMQPLKIHTAAELTLRKVHGNRVMDTVIRSLVGFKDAITHSTPISRHDPKSREADSIRQLWAEILARLENASDHLVRLGGPSAPVECAVMEKVVKNEGSSSR